ncbi:MAG TPA: hypothetical protein VN880_01195, partial [Solirubrobacteraceae bacterium]|nr:hypothetical protein [Solirubrobacteraceae bacterium]
MPKPFGALIAASCALTITAATLLPGSASGASAVSTLPTLKVAVAGKTGIAVSGSAVSGAVSIVSSFSGKGQGGYGLVRLNPGVSFPEALHAVQSHRGDPNA